MSVGWEVALEGRLGRLSLDLRFQTGGAPVAIVGPNGAGKTTLLRVLAGARVPVRGVIRVDGRTLLDSAVGIDILPEQRRIAYLPQGYALFPHLNALDNVAFGVAASSRANRRREARRLLAELSAEHLAERTPERLSGGEQQRVALARALATGPLALLLDEPLAALDPTSRRSTRAFLAEYLSARRRPALVVTHELRDVIALGGRAIVIMDGRVVQVGTVAELAADPANDFVAEFFQAVEVAQR